MALESWAVPRLRELLPLADDELKQVITYTSDLPDPEAARHLQDLLGDSPESLKFITDFMDRRVEQQAALLKEHSEIKSSQPLLKEQGEAKSSLPPPAYSPAAAPPRDKPSQKGSTYRGRPHSNDVIHASDRRAVDEQDMQQQLQQLQYQYRIYNSDVEPEHEIEGYCACPIHQYQQRKRNRLGVQETWCRAVMYPGEKFYSDNPYGPVLFSGNPYKLRIISPYGYQMGRWGPTRPVPSYHSQWIRQTISLNNQLNHEAQVRVDSKEPKTSIWETDVLPDPVADSQAKEKSASRFSRFKTAMGVKSPEEKSAAQAVNLKEAILYEEEGRWPDDEWRRIVASYQDKVGMTRKIAELRARKPIQYLHLLKAGYFEPIPVAWANRASNPLKFSVEAAAGWRGITPTWRGYEDLAEERLYWVLNHRDGGVGARMKPDFISEMNMARERMARAVEPPPLYFSADDTCQIQNASAGYSKQVMPSPFRPCDRPELPTDDTMILLDVSGSMDFDPTRPMYDQYLVTGFAPSTQPKNKDVAKSIIRRFTDAMAHHDHQNAGYDLVSFSSAAKYIGKINHKSFNKTWRNVNFGGGTRVMTGWQKVKELHFEKHSESAIHHPVYGWQAGPETPILRLLLLLDGEATDMDEFELDLLGLSWAHVTIFLIGVDGCPHHHRHANELQRISDVNHHVSFVDAQGNCPERFVTHELLKRHLGYDISMQEFEQMEQLPSYSEYA